MVLWLGRDNGIGGALRLRRMRDAVCRREADFRTDGIHAGDGEVGIVLVLVQRAPPWGWVGFSQLKVVEKSHWS